MWLLFESRFLTWDQADSICGHLRLTRTTTLLISVRSGASMSSRSWLDLLMSISCCPRCSVRSPIILSKRFISPLNQLVTSFVIFSPTAFLFLTPSYSCHLCLSFLFSVSAFTSAKYTSHSSCLTTADRLSISSFHTPHSLHSSLSFAILVSISLSLFSFRLCRICE